MKRIKAIQRQRNTTNSKNHPSTLRAKCIYVAALVKKEKES